MQRRARKRARLWSIDDGRYFTAPVVTAAVVTAPVDTAAVDTAAVDTAPVVPPLDSPP